MAGILAFGCVPADDTAEGAPDGPSMLLTEDFEIGLSAWNTEDEVLTEAPSDEDKYCFLYAPRDSTTGSMWGGVLNTSYLSVSCELALVQRLDLSGATAATLGLTTLLDGYAELDAVEITATTFDATGSEQTFEVTPELGTHAYTWDLANFVGWSTSFGIQLSVAIERDATMLVGVDDVFVEAE